jgi:hypothetical protein
VVAAGQHILQQRKECHVRFDASVGVHSQSLGHRHVGNPATASIARTNPALTLGLFGNFPRVASYATRKIAERGSGPVVLMGSLL